MEIKGGSFMLLWLRLIEDREMLLYYLWLVDDSGDRAELGLGGCQYRRGLLFLFMLMFQLQNHMYSKIKLITN